jgi:hypothetical protein
VLGRRVGGYPEPQHGNPPDTVIAALMGDEPGIAAFGWDDRFVEELRVG